MKSNKMSRKTANPTIRLQRRILKAIKASKKPMSLTALGNAANVQYDTLLAAINFFKKLRVLKIITSTGNMTFVQLNPGRSL